MLKGARLGEVSRMAGGFAALLAALTFTSPASAAGQSFVTVSAGPAEYDLSGTGWSGTGGVQFEYTPDTWWRVEVGSGLFWYRTQGNASVTMLLPEVGFAAEAPPPLPIYLGVGVGHSLSVRGDQPNDPTVFAAIGLSFRMLGPWRLRPEMRMRIVDPWVGGIGGLTLGVTRRLGG